MKRLDSLSRRERQVMDAVYELKSATAKEIRAHIADPPSTSAIRAVLTRLVEGGFLRYEQDGPRYVYSAAGTRQSIRRAALRKLIDTFFDGSVPNTINALLGYSAKELSKQELDEIAEMIAQSSEEKDAR